MGSVVVQRNDDGEMRESLSGGSEVTVPMERVRPVQRKTVLIILTEV